ncbi:MAG: mannitol dehydrogenase family protein [Spirochaetaceae bacterium]|jgi:fructuronate reductase|nr:mannitol dehydrogenase family protein [Spirochaetaceae bacterium]
MLTINKKNLRERRADFEKAGIRVGDIDIDALAVRTAANPRWVHFGAGNLFKAYHAALAQELVERGLLDTGIIALVPNDFSNIETLYTQNDNLFLKVVMKADGGLDKRLISAVTDFIAAGPEQSADWERVKAIFAAPSLQMVTVTITEKGYALKTPDGAFVPQAETDFAAGPVSPTHAMSKIAAQLYERYRQGAHPIALVSTDNFSHNGDKLKAAVETVAKEWARRGLVDGGFLDYLADPNKAAFPLTMIDKITPYASAAVQKQLAADGIGGMEIVTSARGSVTAPFVNTEEAEYLVIEDCFPNSRPPLEAAGVYFTSREKVDMVERMKVCTCLNPLHTALAIFGCLLGYTSIWEEMQDAALAALVRRIAYDEGMPVVTDPGIIKPEAFVREVLEVRFPNPNIPDTPQRIATDTSQKMGIRFGETIKAYIASPSLDAAALKFIPLVIAAWCRYLVCIDDTGTPFTPSPDPLLPALQKELAGVSLGSSPSAGRLKPILSNEKIFGVNLYEAGLGAAIERSFEKMLAAPGAVRTTLVESLAK